MPLPTPNEGEGHDEFIERCMEDDQVLEDFEPGSDQALAVCESQWQKEGAMSGKRRYNHLPEDADVRHIGFGNSETRVVSEEGEPTRIVGYAAVFDSKSEDLGGFREVLEPGAFRSALGQSDPFGLFNHEPDNILGRKSANTLSLHEDDKGLRFSINVDQEDPLARRVVRKIERGELTGNSFSFRLKEDGDEVDTVDGERIRRIKPGGVAEVFDVGPVTYPAYQATVLSTRSLHVLDEEDKEEEGEPEPSAPGRLYRKRVQMRKREIDAR